MPTYDYICKDCNSPFERILTLNEHDKQITCPKCGGKNVTQTVTYFTVVTSRKSAA